MKKAGLSFKVVAPDHGPIWRKNIQHIVDLYEEWAIQKPSMKVVIVYATMWRSTEQMARAISEGLYESGAKVECMSMDGVHRSDVVYEILESGALVAGSPTLN